MKNEIVDALIGKYDALIEVHRTNVLVMLANPIAIHDHTNLLEGIEKELEMIAHYSDLREAVCLV